MPGAVSGDGDRGGRPTLFLDRDGVLNEDLDEVHRPEDFRLVPGAVEAIRHANELGWLVIVITNQAGIARGHYTEEEFLAFTEWVRRRLAEEGARIDATYHCPHHPTEGVGEYRTGCSCRKPEPGMLLRAISEWGIDPARSVMIGDRPRDVTAAERAGVRGILFEGGDLLETVRSAIDAAS